MNVYLIKTAVNYSWVSLFESHFRLLSYDRGSSRSNKLQNGQGVPSFYEPQTHYSCFYVLPFGGK